ncbi:DASH complex subunit Spc34 [Peziza echinospora]|nr:DASH complex subunit Spc34 [Peziza echinospora]
MSSSNLLQHLGQIEAAAASIESLPFPPPSIFTNAILRADNITSLIRDTESHERVLFTVPSLSQGPTRAPRRNTAVAAMLGKDMVEQLRRGGGGGVGGGIGGLATGEVDVDVLLQGAEKLVQNYPMPGAFENVSRLRSKYIRLANSVSALETLVNDQQAQLNVLHRRNDTADYQYEQELADNRGVEITYEMLLREEAEIAALEAKREEMENEIKRMDGELGRNMRGFGGS